MDIKIQKSVQSVTIEPHKIEVEKEDDEDVNEALVQESPVKSVVISSKESEKSASVTQKLDQ